MTAASFLKDAHSIDTHSGIAHLEARAAVYNVQQALHTSLPFSHSGYGKVEDNEREDEAPCILDAHSVEAHSLKAQAQAQAAVNKAQQVLHASLLLLCCVSQ